MNIQILFFASLRDELGVSEMKLVLSNAVTVGEIFGDLSDQFPVLKSLRAAILPAINESYVSWDQFVKEGDTVVFIPPVSGG